MAGLPVQAVAFSIFAGIFGLSTYIISQFKKYPEKYRRGTVTRLNRAKGYGTISPDDKRSEVRVYFHKDHPLAHGLQIGDRVGFQSHYGKKHRPRAINVVVFEPKTGSDGRETVKVRAFPTREPNRDEESELSRASSSANSERTSTCSMASVSSLAPGPRPRRHTLQYSTRAERRSSWSPRTERGPLQHHSQLSRHVSATGGYHGEARGASQPDQDYQEPGRYVAYPDRHSPPSDRYASQSDRHLPPKRYRRSSYAGERYINRYC